MEEYQNSPTKSSEIKFRVDPKSLKEEVCFDGPEAGPFPDKIRPGRYHAICYKVEYGKSWGGRPSIYLKFRIYGGEFDGVELFMACNYPSGKMSYRHKYYKQWMQVNGKPPVRRQRLSARIFLHRMFMVEVIDTRRKADDGSPFPDHMQYSIISNIVETLVGGPQP